MSNPDQNDVGLKLLIQKLEHPIEEIRVSALTSILLKLKHGFIKTKELLSSRRIFVALLEWFNFETVPNKSEALELIMRILEGSSVASKRLIAIGGVEFMSKLRADTEIEVHSQIDKILEKLFLLPDYTFDEEHPIDAEANCQAADDKSPQYRPERGEIQQNDVEDSNNRHVPDISSLYHHVPADPLPTVNSPLEHSGFRLVSLDHVCISNRDVRILDSTNKSIASGDPQLVGNACSVLNDVILRDFLPEIFLQHSQIMNNLLELLRRCTTQLEIQLALKAIRCLSTFVRSLTARIDSRCDAATYNSKRGPAREQTLAAISSESGNSNDSRPSVVGRNDPRSRGDGQDGQDSDTQSGGASGGFRTFLPASARDSGTDHSTSRQTNPAEMGIPHFCVNVCNNCSSLLQSDNPKVLVATFELFNLTGRLLTRSIWPSAIFTDPGHLARSFVPSLVECFKTLSSAALYHDAELKKHITSGVPAPAVVHRLSYVSVAGALAQLLLVALDVKATSSPSQELRVACSRALVVLSLDLLLRETHPALHRSIVAYCEILSEDSHLYAGASVVARAAEASVKFLGRDDDTPVLSSFKMAQNAIPCLHQRDAGEFLDSLLGLLSKTPVDSEAGRFGRNILLSLLTCNDVSLRETVHNKCVDAIRASLSVEKVVASIAEPSGGRIKFLLTTDILAQFVCHGLDDDNANVASATCEILSTLLRSELMISCELWGRLLDALLPLLPRLQAHTDTTTPLGTALFLLVDTRSSAWSKLCLLRCNLRLLFLKDKRVRVNVVARIAWFLGSEEQALYRLPPLSRISTICLSDAFVIATVPAGSSGVPPDDFHHRHFQELLEIFIDAERNSPDARRLAGRRLIFLLSDVQLFDVFCERDGVARVVDTLRASVTTNVPGSSVQMPHSLVELVPICVEILCHVISRDHRVVERLTHSEMFHLHLVRAVLLFPEDESVRRDVAVILSLLLFADPDCENVHKKYCVPLPRNLLDRPSKYKSIDLPFVETSDALIHDHIQRFLRLSLFAAHLGGTKELLVVDTASLPESDRCLIRISHQMTFPLSSFEEVGTATAHRPALVALKILFLRCTAAIAGIHEETGTTVVVDTDMLNAAFVRYLSVQPNSSADQNLLKNVVNFLNFVLSRYRRPWQHDILRWMHEQVCRREGALCRLMSARYPTEPNQDNASPLSPLTKELIAFATALLAETPYNPRVTPSEELLRSLKLVTAFVMQHMNSVEAPQFYNLSSLEVFLQCLVHITARSPSVDQLSDRTESLATCRKLTTLLMEVVVSFHLERDCRDHSFMGRGVTVAASLCLGHLAAEMQAMAAVTRGQVDWIQSWFYEHHADETNDQLGLGWLIPLWTHIDLEVCAASLSIVVSLTRTKDCYRVVAEQMRDVAGGLWGVALSFLLDHTEASIVRERAALLLVNLTTHLLTEDVLPGGSGRWQGDIIVGSDNQTPLVGRAALLALLHRSNFVHEMSVTLRHFSLQDTFQPRVVSVNQTTATNSQAYHWSWTTMTSFGFEGHGTSPVTTTGTSASNDTVSSPDFDNGAWRSTISQAKEVVSVATPNLVSAICLLLRNLLSIAVEEVVRLLKRERLLGLLLDILESSERYTRQCDNHNGATAPTYYPDVIAMLRNLIDLLSNLCQADPSMSAEVLSGIQIFHQLFRLLGLNPIPGLPGSKEELDNLQTSVYMLHTLAVLGAAEETNFVNFVDVLIEHFSKLLAFLFPALEPDSPSSKRNAVLVWLSHLFAKLLFLSLSTNGKERGSAAQTAELLDNRDFSFDDITSKPGSILMTKLIVLHQSIPHNIQSAEELEALECVNDAIANLTAISDAAKKTGVSTGLIASIISRLNRIHAHSNLPISLDTNRASGISTSKDRASKIAFNDIDLICQINLLKNMMHHNENAKMEANKEGLVTTISYFWSTAVLDRVKLLPSLLSMLCNYVAHCPPAAKSLTVATIAVPLTNTSRSLLYEIQTLCHQEIMRGPKDADFPILELGFTILASSSLVPSCRHILAKSKILVIYMDEGVKKMYRGNHRELFSSLWLKLLTNLSFKAEGQEIVAALPEIIEVLMDLVNTGQESERMGALLVLRNLCFLPTRKSKFLHSANLINMLVRTALHGHNQSQTLAASALWALLSNNQKAKTTIKNDNVIHSIQDALESLKSKGKDLNDSQTRTLEILETVFALLNEG